MSRKSEIDQLSLEAEMADVPLTAERVVEAAQDAVLFPELHAFLWKPTEADLASEARIQRAHRLLIQIRIVTDEGVTTRMLMHTNEELGYRPTSSVVTINNLRIAKMRELALDVSRARGRLAAFRSMIPPVIADEIDAALVEAEAAVIRATTAAGPPIEQREAI